MRKLENIKDSKLQSKSTECSDYKVKDFFFWRGVIEGYEQKKYSFTEDSTNWKTLYFRKKTRKQKIKNVFNFFAIVSESLKFLIPKVVLEISNNKNFLCLTKIRYI